MQRGEPDGTDRSSDDTQRMVMVRVAQDGSTAERWARVLEQADIEAEVRIGDAVTLANGSSVWPTAGGGGQQLFAYPIFVPAGQHAAARALLDSVEATDPGSSGSMLRGALIATASALLVAAALMLRGG